MLFLTRLWRNEVEHKKKEMTKQMAAEKKEMHKGLMMQTMMKTVTANMDTEAIFYSEKKLFRGFLTKK